MQVKIISGTNLESLEDNLNAFLEGLDDEPSVKYDLANLAAVVEFKPAQNCLCCDCKFWDDNGDNLVGLCHRCGGRKRFSDKACNKFEDVRGGR